MAFRDGVLIRSLWFKETTGAAQALAHLEESGDGVRGAAQRDGGFAGWAPPRPFECFSMQQSSQQWRGHKMSRRKKKEGFKEWGNLPSPWARCAPSRRCLMTVLDPGEPAAASSHAPTAIHLLQPLAGGGDGRRVLVEQVLGWELSPKPWETWMDPAQSAGLAASPGTAGSELSSALRGTPGQGGFCTALLVDKLQPCLCPGR